MRTSSVVFAIAAAILIGASLAGCGGGSSNSGNASMTPPPPPPPPPPPVTLDPQYLASAASTFAIGCDAVAAFGTVFKNAEVESFYAVDPGNPTHLVASWQEDRWSTGGSHGIVVGASNDGGHTWARTPMPFSLCGAGTVANGGNYERASNAWVSLGPTGIAYVVSLGFDGQVLAPGSVSAVLASRSTDGGATWSAPATLILDGADAFDDKDAVVADPTDANRAYAVWDRLTSTGFGPTYFSRTNDGGESWEIARAIYDPGINNQTIGNIPVVLPNGALVVLFTELDATGATAFTGYFGVIRSNDNGATWSAPIRIANLSSIGTRDPDTGATVRDSGLIAEIAVAQDGSLDVVWQDAALNGGQRDAIALSRSTDGGLTWSTPVRVNSTPTVAAFSPMVSVRGDGEIGVTFYDFRSNTSDRTTLLTDYWLTRSSDGGVTWHESRVTAAFDLDLAPLTVSPAPGGYFLGDYQGLAVVNSVFAPMFVQTNGGDASNTTDVFIAPAVSATGAAAKAQVITYSAEPASRTATPELAQRVHENIVRTMESRVPGWTLTKQAHHVP